MAIVTCRTAGLAGVSANASGPAPTLASPAATPTSASPGRRPGPSRGRDSMTSTMATLVMTSAKLISHTPPTAASASTAGCCHWLTPYTAHGPPSACHDLSHSVSSQQLGTTTSAASARGQLTGGLSRLAAATPNGTHSTPNAAPTSSTRRPDLRRHPVQRRDQVPGPEPPGAYPALPGRRRPDDEHQPGHQPEPGQELQVRRRERQDGQRACEQHQPPYRPDPPADPRQRVAHASIVGRPWRCPRQRGHMSWPIEAGQGQGNHGISTPSRSKRPPRSSGTWFVRAVVAPGHAPRPVRDQDLELASVRARETRTRARCSR